MITDWFESWFDSPYYHILYKDRDDREAAMFIDHISDYLALSQGANVWDLCCGKGRHSIYLNKKGFHTIGTDLSENSICQARQHENAALDFYVLDMRDPFMINFFDAVFNLFTSFGYFENPRDNHKVFKSVFNSLSPNGLFVIDYFNSHMVRKTLMPHYEKDIDGIHFDILKQIEGDLIIKTIKFTDKGKDYCYQEKVKLFDRPCFSDIAEANGFKLLHTFGDYHLQAFDEENSPRLILVFQKQ